MRIARCALLLTLLVGVAVNAPVAKGWQPVETQRYFPMAVWYGGGKARAPMLEGQARSKKEIWRSDVRQIKALGFNTVRAWIDWASGQPTEGRYEFETLVFLFNHARQPSRSEVWLRRQPGDYRAIDVVSGAPVPLARGADGVTLNADLAPAGVQVIKISRRE